VENGRKTIERGDVEKKRRAQEVTAKINKGVSVTENGVNESITGARKSEKVKSGALKNLHMVKIRAIVLKLKVYR